MHPTGAWIWILSWQFWSVQESLVSCSWDSDLSLTCGSFHPPWVCRYVGVERSLVSVTTIPPPPCTNLAPGTGCDFPPNSSGEEPLRSCSSDPKRELARFHWPSWHSRCPLVWGFQFWGSSCTRGNTSYAYWPLPSWSFSPHGSWDLSHIGRGTCNRRKPTRLPWRLRQTMPYGSRCAPVDTYAAQVSVSRGSNLDPPLDSPGREMHTIFCYKMGAHKQIVSTKCFTQLNVFDVKCALNIGLQIILWKRHVYHQYSNDWKIHPAHVICFFDKVNGVYTMGSVLESFSNCYKKQEKVLGHDTIIANQSEYIQHQSTTQR